MVNRPLQLLGLFLSLVLLQARAAPRKRRNFAAPRAEELVALHAELNGTQPKLLARIQKAIDLGRITPIIHQTWKTHDLPPQFKTWAQSWTAQNPDWLHVIWSDEENHKLVARHHKPFLATYEGFKADICRVDAIRPIILHRFGGVYVDLDSQALKPLAGLVRGKMVVLAQMGNNPNEAHSIPNAFMASTAEQPFWIHFVRQIARTAARHDNGQTVEAIAGPIALRRAIVSYRKLSSSRAAEITILPPHLAFPVDWSAKKYGQVPAVCDYGGHPEEFDANECISKHLPDAYSVQWWSHSWTEKGAKRLEALS